MRREAQRVWPFINTEKSHGSLQAVREENDIFVCASWKINQLVFKESQRRRHLSEPGDSIYISSLPFGGFSLMQQKRRDEEGNRAGQSAATPPGFAQQINICGLWTFCTQLLKTNQKMCLFACMMTSQITQKEKAGLDAAVAFPRRSWFTASCRKDQSSISAQTLSLSRKLLKICQKRHITSCSDKLREANSSAKKPKALRLKLNNNYHGGRNCPVQLKGSVGCRIDSLTVRLMD